MPIRTAFATGGASWMKKTNNPLESTMDHEESWSRAAVTFRLTGERKRLLRGLLADGAAQCSPTAAIVRAIDLATAAHERPAPPTGPNAFEFGSNDGCIEHLGSAINELNETALGWRDARAQLASIASDCAELRLAIAAASAVADGSAAYDSQLSIPIKAWLDRLAPPGAAWAVAKAAWRGKSAVEGSRACWTFEARLAGVDGVAALANATQLIELGPFEASGPISRLEAAGPIALTCARSHQHWRISAATMDGAGKLGETLASFDV